MTQITIVGNVTADPDLRYTSSGLAVANFTVAVNRGKDDQKETDFHRCAAWRELGEHVAQLTKGTRVVLVGRMKQRSYETKEGEKRTDWTIDVDAIGPDLRYATAQVTRTEQRQTAESSPWAAQAPADEPWAAGGTSDDTPF